MFTPARTRETTLIDPSWLADLVFDNCDYIEYDPFMSRATRGRPPIEHKMIPITFLAHEWIKTEVQQRAEVAGLPTSNFLRDIVEHELERLRLLDQNSDPVLDDEVEAPLARAEADRQGRAILISLEEFVISEKGSYEKRT
jgi:hypothetical protein